MIIGLTGGIASGKSTAAKTLDKWGAHVIDADKLGHRAYLKDTQAFQSVVAIFGHDVVGKDGEIDRTLLGAKVFGEGNRLAELTAIVWPAIQSMAKVEIDLVKDNTPGKIIVLEAAVLIEAGWQKFVDEVWVTIVDRHIAVERASRRDGIDTNAIETRIDAQISNEARCAKADLIIDNNGDDAQLVAQLKAPWQKLLTQMTKGAPA